MQTMKIKFTDKINFRILIIMLALFAIITAITSIMNRNSIRHLYEGHFTERVLMTNALMATMIQSHDVEYFVELMNNQDDDFKRKQVAFYHDRNELRELYKSGAQKERQAELLNGLTAFYNELSAYKTEKYWEVVKQLNHLKQVTDSTYLYVMADTGLFSKDGEKLYIFIFDADDVKDVFSNLELEESLYIDGLGTCYFNMDTVAGVYSTQKQMEWVSYAEDEYGQLYYAYAPILDDDGNVIAVLGTDLDLGNMNKSITNSWLMLNSVLLACFTVMNLFLYIFIERRITHPLKNLTNTARELSLGNVYYPVPENTLGQRGEIGMLANAIKDMSFTFQEMINSTENLFVAANVGKLDVRNNADNFKGDIKEVIKHINDTLDSVTLYMNSVPASIFIMNKNIDTYFRNEQFFNYFGDIQASEFISLIIGDGEAKAQGRQEYLKNNVSELLKDKNNSTTVWINNSCYSIILKEINLSKEMIENSILVIAVNITDLMREKENAQAAARAKSSFLSRMSHEMRTPMNAIIGMAKIAEGKNDVPRLKQCLSSISVSSTHLLSIINDVLDMSKIDTGKFDLDYAPVNIEKLIIKVCNIAKIKMDAKQQQFQMALSKNLNKNYIADDLRLSQLLTNLLYNAVKFTPENGKIALAVEEISQIEKICALRFSVSDTGIGMTGEQLARLFNAFEQADGGVSRKYGGTGLGLAISKSIIEKMGGRIWAESEYGNGSTFIFEIELELTSNGEADPEGMPPKNNERSAEEGDSCPDLSGVNIILAEDVEINREIFIALLEKTNISIDTAENGMMAVTKFRENPGKYDLIVMDLQMPEVDGFNATRMIRALDIPQAKTIPIIAMTANAFKEDVDNCLEAGMNDHLSKPIDEKLVIEKIAHYAKR